MPLSLVTTIITSGLLPGGSNACWTAVHLDSYIICTGPLKWTCAECRLTHALCSQPFSSRRLPVTVGLSPPLHAHLSESSWATELDSLRYINIQSASSTNRIKFDTAQLESAAAHPPSTTPIRQLFRGQTDPMLYRYMIGDYKIKQVIGPHSLN